MKKKKKKSGNPEICKMWISSKKKRLKKYIWREVNICCMPIVWRAPFPPSVRFLFFLLFSRVLPKKCRRWSTLYLTTMRKAWARLPASALALPSPMMLKSCVLFLLLSNFSEWSKHDDQLLQVSKGTLSSLAYFGYFNAMVLWSLVALANFLVSEGSRCAAPTKRWER